MKIFILTLSKVKMIVCNFKTNYPHLYEEIDFDNPKNPSKEILDQLKTNNSSYIIYWKCFKSKCAHHTYKTSISARVKSNNGCPFCSHHQTCICDSVVSTHPHIAAQFITDSDIENYKEQKYRFKVFTGFIEDKKQWETKDFNIYDMVNHNKNFDITKINIGSNPKEKIGMIKGVFWKCTNPNNECLHHVWDAKFVDRKNSGGCPFCSIPLQRVCECNSVVSQNYFKELDIENPNNPDLETLKCISKNSNLILYWKCPDCNNKWSTMCINRTNGKNCIHCSDMVSKMIKIVNMPDKFDYSLFKYTKSNKKSIIICKEHNITFEDNYVNHIMVKGCEKCIEDKYKLRQSKFKEKFISECNILFNFSYEYNEFIYINTNTAGKIYCKQCEIYFIKTPEHHKNRKEGCPNCSKSYGEINIINILNEMNLIFKCEYKISNISEISQRRFDFLVEYNNKKILIEFDGRQHFKFLGIFHTDYNDYLNRRKIDVLKTILALNEDYCILRISYLEFNQLKYNIEQALKYFDKGYTYYLSNSELYKWISDSIENQTEDNLVIIHN